jgi:hypothetical protein
MDLFIPQVLPMTKRTLNSTGSQTKRILSSTANKEDHKAVLNMDSHSMGSPQILRLTNSNNMVKIISPTDSLSTANNKMDILVISPVLSHKCILRIRMQANPAKLVL